MPTRPTTETEHCLTGRTLIHAYQEPALALDCRIQGFDRYVEHLVFCSGCLGAERVLAGMVPRVRT